MNYKVGTIIELTTPCLGNEKGTRGIIYALFGDGVFQAIFPNGRYDGFNENDYDVWYKVIGEYDLDYDFTNVIKLTRDFDRGIFDDALNIFNKIG